MKHLEEISGICKHSWHVFFPHTFFFKKKKTKQKQLSYTSYLPSYKHSQAKLYCLPAAPVIFANCMEANAEHTRVSHMAPLLTAFRESRMGAVEYDCIEA